VRSLVALLTGLSILVLAPGCAVHQTRCDQDKIRTTLNTLYENQIIDNLVRAANGLPFAQIDYANATSTVTVTETADLGGGQTFEASRQLTLPVKAIIAVLTRTVTDMFTWNVHGENSNQIAVTANPVINHNEVYDAYLQFLNIPGSLIVSDAPPQPGLAHVCKKWHHKYYWVPMEFRYLYLRLALITTVQRGTSLLPPDDFFAVSVQKVLRDDPGEPGRSTRFLIVKISGFIPNDTGRIEFMVDGKTVRYPVTQIPGVDGGARPDSVDTLRIAFDPHANNNAIPTVEDFKARLPMSGKVFFEHSHPEPPNTDALLESLNFQTQQIRLNQLRQRPL
jgi:hypothetical protein